MPELTVLEAIGAALAHEMAHDESVVLLGEDVGTAGGIFRASQGLQRRFGPQRVIDTPLDEKGIAAHAVGMALYGLKPIAEIQFSGFIHDAFEQIMFCGAKYRWATAGQYSCPLVVRAPSFGGIHGGFWHSQSPEAYYGHGGGIKVVVPSTPADAYGLLLAAIRDPDPVLILEPVPLYRALRGEVADDGQALALGEAAVVRPGDDLTLATYGPIRYDCQRVAEGLAAEGIEIEIIDLRSIVPFDIETVVASVERTGRLLIVHEAPLSLGFGAELAATVQSRAFGYLEAPIERVAAPDMPYPYGGGDAYYRPGEAVIVAAARRTLDFSI